MNIYSWLRDSASDKPGKVCLTYKGRELTYGEFKRLTDAFGTSLRLAGIGRGDFVTMVLPNSSEFMIAYLAIAGIGAVVVPVNPAYSPRELAHILKDSGSKALIIERSKVSNYEAIQAQCPLETVITVGDDGNFQTWVSGKADELGEDMASDDVAAMVYSAGLTGYAMGAMLTHGNLSHNSDLMRQCFNCDETDRALVMIPCFHTFSASANFLSMIRLGASMHVMKGMDLAELKYALTEGGVTTVGAVPPLCFAFVHHPDLQTIDYKRLKAIISGGAALPLEIYHAFKERYGCEIYEGYGLTEASPVCSVNSIHKPVKPGSIGTVVPEVEVRVVDENGADVPVGSGGELIFRGPNVMKGYYRHERETNDIIRDGWLYTGDLGHVDADGYIYITGFKKEMIIVSGFNVYNREVEGVLKSIAGVRDAAIVGLPDLMRGATIRAYVVKEAGAELSEKELKVQARSQLANYKTPREFVFVDAIPRDANGKVLAEQLING